MGGDAIDDTMGTVLGHVTEVGILAWHASFGPNIAILCLLVDGGHIIIDDL